MKTVIFFSTDEELLRLTGLAFRKDLWEVGFDLDDWDFGFVSDTEWTEDWDNEHPYYEYWILSRMDMQGVGYEHVEYNGKHYYMLYHA
jgi:hypothetical protein